jgi:hypothetical protein
MASPSYVSLSLFLSSLPNPSPSRRTLQLSIRLPFHLPLQPPESGLAFSATVRDYETHPALRLDERYVILPSPSSTLAIPAIPASASPVPPLSSSSLQVKIETRSLQRRQEPEDEASEADSRPPPRAAAAYKHLVSSPPSVRPCILILTG